MATKPSPPSPPRLTGNQADDFVALRQWFNAFFTNGVRDTRLLDPAKQFVPDDFDAANLPDPTDSSIANAQQTANEAFTDASAAAASVAELDTTLTAALAALTGRVTVIGQLTISDTNTSGIFTHSVTASYYAIVQPSAVSGSLFSVPIGATIVRNLTKASGSLTVEIAQAPSAGQSVTFDILIIPAF